MQYRTIEIAGFRWFLDVTHTNLCIAIVATCVRGRQQLRNAGTGRGTAWSPTRGEQAMRLHGYFRSAASWRVRTALNLKGVATEQVFHHLRRGAQRAPEYLALNPQGLVPALELDDGIVLTQSLAIIEWLEEAYAEPTLLPSDVIERARARAFALALAADTHPLQNLCVLGRLRE